MYAPLRQRLTAVSGNPIDARATLMCMGAGLEIASCCDVRLAAASARFGAPIARLGFPMAPREWAAEASAKLEARKAA